MYVQLVHLALGNEDLLLGVGGFVLKKEREGYVCVFSILNAGGSVCGVCVCTRAHTHALHRWGT